MPAIDPRELRRLFDAHSALLVLYARQWLETAAAEDVVQDVFIALAMQRTLPANVRAWLLRAVRNGALNRLRSQRRRLRREQQAEPTRPSWFESCPDNLIDAATAQDALAALPAEQREVVVLRIWGGLTLKEIAEITTQPVSTLWSRYRAALTAMRARLERPCRVNNP